MPTSSGPRFHRYVGLGDSFTEGVGDHDPLRPNEVRGWADRVAEALARHPGDFGYANLAIRGRKMAAILTEQLEPALDLDPDLVTIYDVDRLHMSSAGRQRMAIEVLDTLGVEHGLVPFDLAPLPEMDRRQRRNADLAWARAHAGPWVRRRLFGTSSGDGLAVRRPTLSPVQEVG